MAAQEKFVNRDVTQSSPPTLKAILSEAQREAQDLGEDSVSTEHLLLALLNFPDSMAVRLLAAKSISVVDLRYQLGCERVGGEPLAGKVRMTARVERILQIARHLAVSAGCAAVGTHHLLAALLLEGEGLVARVLQRYGLGAEALKTAVLQAPCE